MKQNAISKTILVMLIAMSTASHAQYINFSGTWKGMLGNGNRYTLALTLIDSCGPVYSAVQYDWSDSVVSKYRMIQSRNMLIRDAVTSWYSSDGAYPAHQLFKYVSGKLVSERRWLDLSDQHEYVSLSNGKPLKLLPSCPDRRKDIPCAFALHSGIPTEVVTVGDSAQLSVEIMDTDVNDSDLVTIFFGNNKMLDRVPIFTNAIYSLPMNVTQDTLITWCACNTGLNGQNTGRIRIVELRREVRDNHSDKARCKQASDHSNSQTQIQIQLNFKYN